MLGFMNQGRTPEGAKNKKRPTKGTNPASVA